MRNICLVGRMGAGKTTLANVLTQEHGYRRLSFAAPVKIAACRVYNVMQQATDSGEIPLKPLTPTELEQNKAKYRTLLQLTGTELGRDLFGEDVWVNKLIQQLQYANTPIVIDDVRFRNELVALINEGFYPVYLTRSDQKMEHSSESLTKNVFEKIMRTTGRREGEHYVILDNNDLDEYTSKQAVINIALN